MKHYLKPIIIGVGGAALAGTLAGWAYGNAAGATTPGSTTPIAVIGSLCVAGALLAAAKFLQPFSRRIWVMIWIGGAISYPLVLDATYHGVGSLARNAVVDSAVDREQQEFRAENGRDATPEEVASARDHLNQELDDMASDPNGPHEAEDGVNAQLLWGPVWVSLVAGLVLLARPYRLKWRPNLERFIEKRDDP